MSKYSRLATDFPDFYEWMVRRNYTEWEEYVQSRLDLVSEFTLPELALDSNREISRIRGALNKAAKGVALDLVMQMYDDPYREIKILDECFNNLPPKDVLLEGTLDKILIPMSDFREAMQSKGYTRVEAITVVLLAHALRCNLHLLNSKGKFYIPYREDNFSANDVLQSIIEMEVTSKQVESKVKLSDGARIRLMRSIPLTQVAYQLDMDSHYPDEGKCFNIKLSHYSRVVDEYSYKRDEAVKSFLEEYFTCYHPNLLIYMNGINYEALIGAYEVLNKIRPELYELPLARGIVTEIIQFYYEIEIEELILSDLIQILYNAKEDVSYDSIRHAQSALNSSEFYTTEYLNILFKKYEKFAYKLSFKYSRPEQIALLLTLEYRQADPSYYNELPAYAIPNRGFVFDVNAVLSLL